MLLLKNLTMKNFMSSGEIPQVVKFDSGDISLIIGENYDMIAENQIVSRNGSGKTMINQALSYALFGQSINNIKRDNLVNNINEKNMFVILEFDCNNHSYRIERGRKPAFFKFFIDNKQKQTDDDDESQGESRLTQQEVEKKIDELKKDLNMCDDCDLAHPNCNKCIGA